MSGPYITETQSPTTGAALNPVVVSNEGLRRELERRTYFTRMTTDMALTKKGDDVKPNVIIKNNDLSKNGGDHVRVVFLKKLANEPTYGDKPMRGNEEQQSTRYRDVFINMVKHAVKTTGRMSEYRIKKFQLWKNVRPQMAQYFARENDTDCYRALLQGLSNNLLVSATYGGLGINSSTVKSHPNLLVAGYAGAYSDTTYTGLAKYSSTAATYETNVGSAIFNQPTDSTSYFHPRLLDRMIPLFQPLGLEPLPENDLFVCLIHTNQWMQAYEFGGPMFNLFEKVDLGLAEKSALFQGGGDIPAYIYKNKLVVHINDYVPGVSATNAGVITYDYATSRAFGTNNQRIGFILGANSLAWAEGEPIRYDEEVTDYGNQLGIQASMMYGMERCDWSRNDGQTDTTRAGINISSMAFCTYSPVGAFTAAPAANQAS